MSSTLVSSIESVADLVATIRALPPSDKPALYVDLEGISLSRHGSISLVAVYVLPRQHVYLVDVHTLQAAAFDTAAADGTTLRSILESPGITKVFFDLMENACRPAGRRRFLNGLDRCIEHDSGATPTHRAAWKEAKEKGLGLFHPSRGGSYEAFNARPLDADLTEYCVNDVLLLPVLRDKYLARLDGLWRTKVSVEAAKRVVESQAPTYEPQGKNKRFGPWEVPFMF